LRGAFECHITKTTTIIESMVSNAGEIRKDDEDRKT
jgi:hypothetical protein